jgi:hypothetical protein
MFVLLGAVVGLALDASGRTIVGGVLVAISLVRAAVLTWRSRARRRRIEAVALGRFVPPHLGPRFSGPVYDTTGSDRGAAA